MPQYQKAVLKAKWTEGLPTLRALADAQERYRLATGAYASDISDLDIDAGKLNNFTTMRVLHSTTRPHTEIQFPYSNTSYVWMAVILDNGQITCGAPDTNTENQKMCVMLTGNTDYLNDVEGTYRYYPVK